MRPIGPPDFKTRMEIIRKKALGENAHLPAEVIHYMAERVTGDIRRLESCLIGIIAKSNIQGVPVTLDLARELTETMLDRLPKLTIDHIQQIVCCAFQYLGGGSQVFEKAKRVGGGSKDRNVSVPALYDRVARIHRKVIPAESQFRAVRHKRSHEGNGE